MTMDKEQAEALWERIDTDYREHNYWSGASRAVLSPVSPVVLGYHQVAYRPTAPGESPTDLKIFGMPVRLDPTLPPNEIRLVDAISGKVWRIVNIGDD
jgi:hypothetical protein